MNSCCTVSAPKLNAIVPAPRPARWFSAGLQRLIDTAAFTAVDLTHIFFVDPDRPETASPRRIYPETR
jgi:hypothetical protein